MTPSAEAYCATLRDIPARQRHASRLRARPLISTDLIIRRWRAGAPAVPAACRQKGRVRRFTVVHGATGRTVGCSSRTRGRCDSSRGEFGLVSRQHGDGDRLQSLPALPPRRATSCRALADHVPDHPAQGEEQPAQPRKAPALAAAPRTPGGERAHRQPDRRRQAKRPNARSTHPSTLPSPGGRRCSGTFE